MDNLKVFFKGIDGFITGLVSAIVANPEAVTTLVGSGFAMKIGAVSAMIVAFTNWLKHKDK
jgi:hypothetical protein